MSQRHLEYYRKVYPGIWREKVRRYGVTDYHRRVIAFLRRQISSGKDGRALEVAIGMGEPIAAGVAGPVRLFGIDIARASLEAARTRLPAVGLVEGSAQRLPFRGDAFHLVYCLQSSWCLQDVGRLIGEMTRVASPGGVCVVDLMNRGSPRVALTQGLMRLRSLATPGLAGFMRQRACDPWKVLAELPPGVAGELRDARDLDRLAGGWRDRFSPRLVLVFRKSRP